MKTVVVVLSVALVAVGGGAINLWRQLEANRHQIGELQAQVAGLEAASHGVVAQPVALATPAMPATEPAVAKPVEPASKPSATTDSARASVDAIRANMGSPESIARTRALQRAQMPAQYPDVGKALGLSPQEVEKLFDLLADQSAERSRIVAGNRPDTGPQALGNQMSQEQTQLADLLGDKFSQWKEYNTQLPTRRQVKDLGAVLTAAGAPLTEAQAGSLIPAVTAAEKENTRQRMPQSGPASLLASMNRFSPEANQRILDAAAPHLTPQQLDAYRQMLERQAAQERAMRDSLLEAQKRVEAAK